MVKRIPVRLDILFQRTRDRGAIMPMAAVGAISVLGALGISIDVGNVFVAQQQLKAAADAAALKGAASLAQGGTMPNFSLASTTANSALGTLRNQSNGQVVVSATVLTGGYDMSPSKLGFQMPFVANGTQAPAVQVSMTKSGANGVVDALFSRVLGINSFMPKASSVSIGGFAPSTSSPGQVIPLAVPQSMMNTLWNPSTNQPRVATSTKPLYTGGRAQTPGEPYAVRIWDNDCGTPKTQTVPGVGEISPGDEEHKTGAWHSYDSRDNAALIEATGGSSGTARIGGLFGYTGSRSSGSYSRSTPITNTKEMSETKSVNLCSNSDSQTSRQSVLNASGGGHYAGYVTVVDSCNRNRSTGGVPATITAFAAVKIVGSGQEDLQSGSSLKSCGYVDVQLIPPGKDQVSETQDPVRGIRNDKEFSCVMEGRGVSESSYVVGVPKVVD